MSATAPCPNCGHQVTVYDHPLRVAILTELTHAKGALSPKLLAERLGHRLGNVAYHTRVLADRGDIELVATAPRRGATEHYYQLHGAGL